MDGDVAALAREQAPSAMDVDNSDLLIVTSHDCDILNPSIEKEPFVEVLCARRAEAVDRMQLSGRNPRLLQLSVIDGAGSVTLSCISNRRWVVPRTLLMQGEPRLTLPDRERRLAAEWLAKRYIRAAFPTAFDRRWRSKLGHWQKLLRGWSEWLQGIYLRLSTLAELDDGVPYGCDLIVAVPHRKTTEKDWARLRRTIEEEVVAFWGQFEPHICCSGVVLGSMFSARMKSRYPRLSCINGSMPIGSATKTKLQSLRWRLMLLKPSSPVL